MLLQLDPGFTPEAFLANAALAIIGAVFGAVGAFVAAWVFFRQGIEEERKRSADAQAAERAQRQEDAAAAESLGDVRRLQQITAELDYNFRLARQISRGGGLVPLRTAGLETVFLLAHPIPPDVASPIISALYAASRYNWFAANLRSESIRPLRDAMDGSAEGRDAAAKYLEQLGYGWISAKNLPDETQSDTR